MSSYPSDTESENPSPTDAELLDAYSHAVITVADAMSPSVVNIQVLAMERQRLRATAVGSGVAITPDGYILTNHHVVERARRLQIALNDGSTADASFVGGDSATDLAVIRCHDSLDATAQFGESNNVRAGQLVIAIGNPYGFESSISTGVVSALGRSLRSRDGRLIENVVQHTAPLNPGSSGGALLDSHSRLVGINTAIVAEAEGIGFAIPATTAQVVFSEILVHGRVRRSYLGIAGRTRPLDRRLVRHLDLPAERAVEALEVMPGSPAHRAGLHMGDIVVSLDGELVTTIDDLFRLLARIRPGATVPLLVLRRSRLVEVDVQTMAVGR
ncbi:MAG: trypsin-like peptidase domain-containing protein [Ectothiorhodospiraceae bacterium]|jgi:S1-C subfamily serine protease